MSLTAPGVAIPHSSLGRGGPAAEAAPRRPAGHEACLRRLGPRADPARAGGLRGAAAPARRGFSRRPTCSGA